MRIIDDDQYNSKAASLDNEFHCLHCQNWVKDKDLVAIVIRKEYKYHECSCTCHVRIIKKGFNQVKRNNV